MNQEYQPLSFRQGKSDKVYNVRLLEHGDAWAVEVVRGPRVGTQISETKIGGVSHAEAKKLFDRLVREKTAKGYTPSPDGTPFKGTENAGRKTQHAPQLLNPIEDAEPCILDPDFWGQEKYDGHRVLIQRTGSTITGINRKGLTIALPEAVATRFLAVSEEEFVLDGELVGDQYHPFDVLGHDAQPYSQRLQRLVDLVGKEPPTARTEAEKRQLVADIQARGGEGVVFKRHDAPYTPGRPNSGGAQLKLKFTQTASFTVLGKKSDKRSIELGIRDAGKVRSAGFVTVPPNQGVPEVGSVVEVRYLYAFPQGGLHQPHLIDVRCDVIPEDCVAEQLKFKAGDEEA